jgi:ELWxxDGT repeat protein
LLAFAAELVADINDTPSYPATNPAAITEFNGFAVYSAETATTGRELWRSDGTLAGTSVIKDIVPGSGSANPVALTNVNGVLYFVATTPANGAELWRSDGTAAGTFLLKGIRAGSAGSSPQNLINVGGTLYFTANDGVHGTELWASDGTKAGTLLVRDIRTGTAGSSPSALIGCGGLVYFSANEGTAGHALWRSDGTAAGTIRISAHSPSPLLELTEVVGKVFFSKEDAATGRELWMTDGSLAGTTLVKNIKAGSSSSNPEELTNVNGTLLFRADNGVHGQELFRCDGTAAGTFRVGDLLAGPDSFGPRNLINTNGVLYFTDRSGNSLWTSDGTGDGTREVSNFPVDATVPFVNVGGTLYFSGAHGRGFDGSGFELWRSDGTQAGTLPVADIYPGTHYGDYDGYTGQLPNSSLPQHLTPIAGKVFFQATDASGSHLWSSDGTEMGTQLIDKVFPRTPSANPRALANFNGKLLFGTEHDYSTWISDGTADGTLRLATHGSLNQGNAARDFAAINDVAYFSAGGRTSGFDLLGRELWKTDGTQAGTVWVADIVPGEDFDPFYGDRGFSSYPSGFTALSGKVVFAASENDFYSADANRELWATDGTTEGTAVLKDIYPGLASSDPMELLPMGRQVFFTADDGIHGRELWITDGTAAGTQSVKDINVGAMSSKPHDVVVLGNTLYFSADDGAHGRELWRSDGTAAGTVMVKDITPVSASSNAANLTEVRGTLYFTTSPDGGD